jgi:hypothetical protein
MKHFTILSHAQILFDVTWNNEASFLDDISSL